MPQYAYRAVDKNSRISSGVLIAESETVLERRMAALGLWLVEARPQARGKHATRKVKATRRDLVDFFNGLATLVDAGVDIAESLNVLVNETVDEGFKRVLDDVRLNIQSGVNFYDAMSAHPEVFTPEICNLVRAGEHSGELVAACYDISDHLEWLDQLMGDVKQATMYPAMIATAVMGLVFLMFSFVVPQFSVIFDSLNIELPTITKVVVTIGDFCNRYWWALLLGVGVLFCTVKFGPVYSPSMAYAMDKLKLQIPVFGPVNQLLVLSRFAHNMALMLKAGVPIIEAMSLVAGVVANRVMQAALESAQQAVTDGRRMSQALSDHDIISPIVMRMIVVGEETGKLDSCLEKVSSRMDDEIPRRIKRLFGVLEPMIILILLGIVGMVAAAIFLPLFSLMSGIRG
ncbi:MAG: type II secretion system F family protein [bacterium]